MSNYTEHKQSGYPVTNRSYSLSMSNLECTCLSGWNMEVWRHLSMAILTRALCIRSMFGALNVIVTRVTGHTRCCSEHQRKQACFFSKGRRGCEAGWTFKKAWRYWVAICILEHKGYKKLYIHKFCFFNYKTLSELKQILMAMALPSASVLV